ncbi:MAG: hypothetical protein ABI142_08880, partial [Bryocella sp.]
STGATGAAGPFMGGTYSAALDYPAGSVVVASNITYLAIQTNGPTSTIVTPGSNVAYWVATSGGAGAGSANYINLSTNTNFSYVVGTPIVFPSATAESGISYNSTTGQITVITAGVYVYDFYLSEGNGAAITVNGVGIDSYTGGMSSPSGHGSLTLNAGDVVTLVPIYSSGTMNESPSITGSLSLVSIGQGATGATGSIGAVTNYSASATYSSGMVVYCPASGACTTGAQGSSYIYVSGSPSAGKDPYNNTGYWQQITAAGATGLNGVAGVSGVNGATGATGATGAAGSGGSSSAIVLSGAGSTAVGAVIVTTDIIGNPQTASVLPLQGFLTTPVNGVFE